MCAGNALIIWNGPAEVHFTLRELQAQWTTVHMRIFVAALLVVLAGVYAAILFVRRLERAQHQRCARQALALADREIRAFANEYDIADNYVGYCRNLTLHSNDPSWQLIEVIV